ncbi:hypothetical protein J6590_082677 [Homalodisca vitripennis]|nr:hypothetical protein J6590_082677 [Homalodisca vitripennis]
MALMESTSAPMDSVADDLSNEISRMSCDKTTEQKHQFGRTLVCVEYPAIVQNDDKMIQSLGGIHKISKDAGNGNLTSVAAAGLDPPDATAAASSFSATCVSNFRLCLFRSP